MKIKTVNNRNTIIGGIVAYTILILFLFVGFYLKQKSYLFLIIGFSILSIVIYALVRRIKSTVFYSNQLSIHSPFQKTRTVDLKKNNIQLHLIGGTHYIGSYTITLWINGEKITSFRLNNSEWEFEEFYHSTKGHDYRWKIHDGQKAARTKDYQLFLKRKAIMDSNSNKHNTI